MRGREKGGEEDTVPSWGLPSLVDTIWPCGWLLRTPCCLLSSQVVLKGDAKKSQLYGVSVLGWHVGGAPVGKAQGTLSFQPGSVQEPLKRRSFYPSIFTLS